MDRATMRLGLGRQALGVLLGYGLVIVASPALHDFQHGLSDTPDNCAACLATRAGAPAEQAFTFGSVDCAGYSREPPGIQRQRRPPRQDTGPSLAVTVDRTAIARYWLNLGITKATREAALLRLRPIMMTALVAALGLLPAALSTGVGSDSQRPFALVIVSGLFSRLLISIFLMPALYAIVSRPGDRLEV